MNGRALGVDTCGLAQDFLGLQVATIGEIHVRFGHGIDLTGVQLAGRIGQGRRAGGQAAVGRVHALTAAGAEERVRRQLAVHDGAVGRSQRLGLAVLCDAVAAVAKQ
ncbi:hypothetical protein SDC9_159800 [bioreactor metagenome]|uniref:Uncharacterized protein n=1 Tax=bioreactor metagenome TaxID=1076179 RepID=A0A645FG68_9ZZZZ